MYVTGLLFYGFHFPECVWPGRFDSWGASHQVGVMSRPLFLVGEPTLDADMARCDCRRNHSILSRHLHGSRSAICLLVRNGRCRRASQRSLGGCMVGRERIDGILRWFRSTPTWHIQHLA